MSSTMPPEIRPCWQAWLTWRQLDQCGTSGTADRYRREHHEQIATYEAWRQKAHPKTKFA